MDALLHLLGFVATKTFAIDSTPKHAISHSIKCNTSLFDSGRTEPQSQSNLPLISEYQNHSSIGRLLGEWEAIGTTKSTTSQAEATQDAKNLRTLYCCRKQYDSPAGVNYHVCFSTFLDALEKTNGKQTGLSLTKLDLIERKALSSLVNPRLSFKHFHDVNRQ